MSIKYDYFLYNVPIFYIAYDFMSALINTRDFRDAAQI